MAELALSSQLRRCPAILSAAVACQSCNRTLVVAPENAAEATMPVARRVICPSHLNKLSQWLHYPEKQLTPEPPDCIIQPPTSADLLDVRGQEQAKRALTIAAVGHHNLLMCGPPSTGKTMLAQRLHGLLAPLTEPQALSLGAINSSLGIFNPKTWRVAPWRAPHHSESSVSLVGVAECQGQVKLAKHTMVCCF